MTLFVTGCVQNFWKAEGGIGGTLPAVATPPGPPNMSDTLFVTDPLTLGQASLFDFLIENLSETQ